MSGKEKQDNTKLTFQTTTITKIREKTPNIKQNNNFNFSSELALQSNVYISD